MINREIINDVKLVYKFDFFNDYKDTVNWLQSKHANAKLSWEKAHIGRVIKLLKIAQAEIDKKRFDRNIIC